jgi:hypothetical protein
MFSREKAVTRFDPGDQDFERNRGRKAQKSLKDRLTRNASTVVAKPIASIPARLFARVIEE